MASNEMKHHKVPGRVTLEPLIPEDVSRFCLNLQRAFDKAVVEEFGSQETSVISVDEITKNIAMPGAQALKIMRDGTWVGGAVVRINEATQNNDLDLLYIDVANHGGGIGQAAWRALEARYPETKVWGLVTPYFERRNIHFYVNRCDFHIVEFYNELNPDPHEEARASEGDFPPGFFTSFRFEKVMKKPSSQQ